MKKKKSGEGKKKNLVYSALGLSMLAGIVLQFIDFAGKITKSVELYGSTTDVTFGRAIVPFVVFIFMVALSLIITAAVAYRSPQLGDDIEKNQLSSLEVSSASLNNNSTT